jgi:small subunit ribosomal protein S20
LPTHKSVEKRLKTSKKANIKNKQIKTRIKTLIKKTETVSDETSLRQTTSLVDSAARKSIIHPNKAARIKSRLAKLVQKKEPPAGQ